MTLKHFWATLSAHTWYRIRPISPQHRSREAWIRYSLKHNRWPDGVKR